MYLHIPPYFVFADSGGSVKPVHLHWLAQTLGAHVQKAYCKFSTCFFIGGRGAQQGTWPACIHMRSLARAFGQRVNVSIANTLNACVKLSWCLVCQCKK